MTNRKKLFIILGLFLIGVIVVVPVFSWFVTSTITISSSPRARIFVKQGSQNFQEVGTGQATFRTRNTETVFIEAREGGRATQKNIQPSRRSTIEVSLELKQPGTAERVALVGPFLHPLVHNGFIYGIASDGTTSVGYLNAGPLRGSTSGQYPGLPSLPLLKQIVWHDTNNFIYITASEGAGVVSTNPNLEQSGLPYIGVAAPNTTTTALISGDGLHLTEGLSIKNAPLISRSEPDTLPFVFADESLIFFGWTSYEQEHEESGGGIFEPDTREEIHEKDPGIDNITLKLFSHSGEEQDQFTLPIKSQIFRITSVNRSTVAVLTGEGLYLVDVESGDIQIKNFTFGRVQDLINYQGNLLLLGSAGLWEYDIAEDSYHKIAGYPKGEAYVPYSLSISDNSLYFSTQAEEHGDIKTREATNSVFKVLLND